MREVFHEEHLGAMPAVIAVHYQTKSFSHQLCLATCGYTDQTLRSSKKSAAHNHSLDLFVFVCISVHLHSFSIFFLYCALTYIIP